jgi:MOSC domain-containing protein YiiM
MPRESMVLGIFSAPQGQSGLPRPKAEELDLQEGYGIVGDKFAAKEMNQTVMIVGRRAYDLAEEAGIDLEPGSLGENLILECDPHQLTVGTHLQVGTAVIALTEACTLCNHLSIFDRKLPKLVRHDRGVYCRIVRSGLVRIGDSVRVIDERRSA